MNQHVGLTQHSAARRVRLGSVRTAAGLLVAATVGMGTFAGLAAADTTPVYPPAQGCAMQGQPASATPGATVVITGTSGPGAAVSAVLMPEGQPVGSGVADTTGAYSVTVHIPGAAHGQDQITVGGITCAAVVVVPPPPSTSTQVTAPVTPSTPPASQGLGGIVVTKSSASQQAPTSPPASPAAARSHPLAFTGASVLIPGALGAIFIGIGAVLFLLGRRGKPRHN